MNWIVSVFAFSLAVVASDKLPVKQITNVVDPEVHVLNLHFDHCRRPKTFSWNNLKCECPLPLIDKNGKCVCGECIYENTHYKHSEGSSEKLPRFINEIFEEIHDELEDTEVIGKNDSENKNIKNETSFENNAKNENDDALFRVSNMTINQVPYLENVTHSPPTTVIENTNEDKLNLEWRRMLGVSTENYLSVTSPAASAIPYKLPRPKKCRKSNYNRKNMKKPFQIIFGRRMIGKYNPETKSPKPLLEPKIKKLKMKLDTGNFKLLKLTSGHKPKSYSGSVVGSFRSGKIGTGVDRAKGTISNRKGTGAISLGSGGGSAGGTAFTGIGKSGIAVSSKGTSATGFSLIGKHGKQGVSTSSLLLGTGDVVAVNALGVKGSSSGVGITTKNTAGAASSAFGPASASVSAAAGKGATKSSSTLNKTLETSAGVERQNGALVESAAVGNPNQDIAQLKGDGPDLVQIAVQPFQPINYDFDSFFSK